jgi:hypothetical protein
MALVTSFFLWGAAMRLNQLDIYTSPSDQDFPGRCVGLGGSHESGNTHQGSHGQAPSQAEEGQVVHHEGEVSQSGQGLGNTLVVRTPTSPTSTSRLLAG